MTGEIEWAVDPDTVSAVDLVFTCALREFDRSQENKGLAYDEIRDRIHLSRDGIRDIVSSAAKKIGKSLDIDKDLIGDDEPLITRIPVDAEESGGTHTISSIEEEFTMRHGLLDIPRGLKGHRNDR